MMIAVDENLSQEMLHISTDASVLIGVFRILIMRVSPCLQYTPAIKDFKFCYKNFQKDSVDTAADAQGWILHGTKCVILPTQKKKTRRADGGRLERHERIRFVLRSTAATSGSTMSIATQLPLAIVNCLMCVLNFTILQDHSLFNYSVLMWDLCISATNYLHMTLHEGCCVRQRRVHLFMNIGIYPLEGAKIHHPLFVQFHTSRN